jgi:hypothetical protein
MKNPRNPSDQMIVWNRILETERIKKLSLIVIESPHHRQPP